MEGTPEKPGVPSSFFRLGAGGFTLVELMIVVAILGTLATIAIPNYLRMRNKAKVAEAKANLGAISVVQYSYYAEYSQYVGNQAMTPDRGADPPARFAWDPNTRFSLLGYAPDGRVYYSYALLGGDFPVDGFTVEAQGDVDGNGVWATWTLTGGDKELRHSGDQF